ncbi:hypothetical protein SDC9_92571 [bioreactor metagenome]|uniref:HTH cro/C1-type domain-containing protein n=1 Tax=bioreactor metagenome TaxID=1076179 RepID=A0A644ZY40_9ZZZZ
MKVNYKRLWKLLIDKNLSKIEMRHLAAISSTSLAKLGKNENVSMNVLKKICGALKCNIGEIMDILPDEPEEVFDKKAESKEQRCEENQ